MSNVKRGLAALKEHNEEIARRRKEMDRPKAEWFKLGEGESKTVRFLQELDEDSDNYNADRGLAIMAVEHNAPGPDGFKRRALCTSETDVNGCFACQQHELDPKAGWRPKTNLYIEVLVAEGDKKSVQVLSRNINSSFVQNLFEWATENGTITDRNFKITRTGEGKGTTWNLLPVLRGEPFDDSDVTVPYDLEEAATRNVPYDKQPTYYGVADVDVNRSEGESEAEPADSFNW